MLQLVLHATDIAIRVYNEPKSWIASSRKAYCGMSTVDFTASSNALNLMGKINQPS